ncbi:MAG: RES family NAD+ phosphorylase [Alphaproteobacteria bacterium]
MIHAADLDIRDFTNPSTIRLIPSAYIDEPALTPLADDARGLSLLEEIEGLTSARRSLRLSVPGGLDPAELLTPAHGYGWTYVNAAFCYPRPTGSRFNGPERGAWYACFGDDSALTAQSEVAWHLTRELIATGIYDNITAYRELIAGFTSRFHDLAGREGEIVLGESPATAYPAGQALARDIFGNDGNGLLYPSARRQGGQCLAAFRPHLVQNVQQGTEWVFTWRGSPSPDIVRR